MSFVKAVKSQAKLRMALAGPSGSGKTYSALAIGLALANGGRLALVDTEHGSAKKYAGDFDFDVLEMEPPFHPDRFVEAISEASKAGYTVIVLDSLSHAWNGTGGLLEIVDQVAARMKTSNTFAAWKDATPIQNRLIDAIVRADIHVIATMRSKQEYVLEQIDRGGKTITVPKKVGMAPVQRDSFEYEFDIAGELDLEHNLIISKTRCRALDNAVISRPGAQLAETITAWLGDGTNPPLPPVATKTDKPDQKTSNGKSKLPRPMAPEDLKEALAVKARKSTAPMTPEQADYLVSSLGKACDGDDTKRHTVTKYLFGRESLKEYGWTKGEASALTDWLGANAENEYTPNPDSLKEIELIIRQFQVEAGQADMFTQPADESDDDQIPF